MPSRSHPDLISRLYGLQAGLIRFRLLMLARASRHRRTHAYAADLGASKPFHRHTQSPRLGIVDLDIGEINDI
jgi:hypothetical protein